MEGIPVNKDSSALEGRLLIKVSGTVQGVGFRPFVYGLATELGLKGFVANTSRGVTIDIEGKGAIEFLRRLKSEAPPLSSITQVTVEHLPMFGYEDFRIVQSMNAEGFTLISPDMATCEKCSSELMDPVDRRYRYPFINCTDCGPRYSITRSVPYDRPNTTMQAFTMCRECEAEYTDPADRRFHAVPNACPACGPHVELYIGDKKAEGDPLVMAGEILKQGKVLALKGLGGFHLACDATSDEAVALLRERKRKSNKPFALMARDIDDIRHYCVIAEDEEMLLLSPRRPVVLLKKREATELPDGLAPGNDRLGFMLPYTPLHRLLLEEVSRPLVMTSGNLSEEPIQKDNNEAREKLAGIADAFLVHDRDIFMRVDDSVLKIGDDRRQLLIRRARGYAPEPILLGEDGPDVLAVGADIKNTFTLTKGSYAVMSQHIGDMENFETIGFFEEVLENLKAVYRAEPVALAHDMHPGYMSTRWALEQDMKKLPVQHHHAHIVSVMATKGLRKKVIGVALDGTGYGPDGTLWGGEFLLADSLGFERAGHFANVPLPGGERAVREPWRMAVSYMLKSVGDKETLKYLGRTGLSERVGEKNINDVLKVSGMPEVSPLTSGAGRLFDAASSLLGVRDFSTFEGEAAMALESLASKAIESVTDSYPVNISYPGTPAIMEIDFSYVLIRMVSDISDGVPGEVIAARFHNAVVEAVARVVLKLVQQYNIREVVLGGGVLQNDILRLKLREQLLGEYLNVHVHENVPLNDAGVSLGQAFILQEAIKAGKL